MIPHPLWWQSSDVDPTPVNDTPTSSPAGRRRLSLFDVLCIAVNATVGSGVFALPDDLQRAMGGWSPVAYLLCAVLLLPVALSFAELAGRVDETGGAYVYARRAFGDRVGFIVGWTCWVNTFLSWAANTTLLIELVAPHGGIAAAWVKKILAVSLILTLGLVNFRGVRPGARLVTVVVIGKLVAILCFVLVALFSVRLGRLGGPLPLGVTGIGQGIYLALFPLQGFEVAPVTAGETENPRRNVPRGILGALIFSMALFILVQTVLVASYPLLANPSDQPLTDAAFYLGRMIGIVVLTGSFLSIGGFTAGSALGAPRYAEAIATHGLLPKPLARIHPRFGTPHVAILVTTLLTAVLAAWFDYRRLIGMSNVTVVIQYFFACLAVPVLRKREAARAANSLAVRQNGAKRSGATRVRRGGACRPLEQDPRAPAHFVIPGGPILPLVGAASSLVLFSAASRTELAFALATIVVGALSFRTRNAPRGSSATYS